MSRMQKRKGKDGELALVGFLTDLGYPARRTQQYSGEGASDVIWLPGMHIECKYQARPNILDAIRQAHQDSDKDIPVVFSKLVKRGGAAEPWLFTCHASELPEIVKIIHRGIVK